MKFKLEIEKYDILDEIINSSYIPKKYKHKKGDGIYNDLTLDSSDEEIMDIIEKNRIEYSKAYVEYIYEFNNC